MESENNNVLKCEMCGATVSQKGRPFTVYTLKLHQCKCQLVNGQPVNGQPPQRKTGSPTRLANRRKIISAQTQAKFCPECGCNLGVVNAALNIMDGGAAA